jgi:hypothetical protein
MKNGHRKKPYSLLCFLLAALFILTFYECRAQSEYEQRGTGGIVGSAGFFSGSGTAGGIVAVGYSPRGIWDVGFTWEKGGSGPTANGVFSPNFTYYILKQEDAPRLPSLGVSVSYSRYSVEEVTSFVVPVGAAGVKDSSLTNNTAYNFVTLMGIVHRQAGTWRNFDFQPFLGGGFALSSREWDFVWRGGVSITKLLRPNMTLVIKPFLQREPANITTFILSAGILL